MKMGESGAMPFWMRLTRAGTVESKEASTNRLRRCTIFLKAKLFACDALRNINPYMTALKIQSSVKGPYKKTNR